jgi:hypothetical protein
MRSILLYVQVHCTVYTEIPPCVCVCVFIFAVFHFQLNLIWRQLGGNSEKKVLYVCMHVSQN